MLKWLLGGLLVLVGITAIVLTAGYFALKRPDIPYETLAAEYESAASRYAELPGGVRMHYRDEGNPNGPVLLLIHGFAASLHTWEQWVAALGDEYRVVSLDLPGHGLTRAPAGYQANIEALRDVVAAFAQVQGLNRFTIVGNSMGGNVAWEYALAHPEQLDALILVDASGWPEVREELADEPTVFQLLRNPVAGPMLRGLDNTRLFRQGLEASFADPSLVTDEMVERHTRLSRAAGHRDILWQLTTGFRERNYATPERLAAINSPTLILWGDQDNLIEPSNAQLFGDAIAGSQVVMFENVGHIPQEEHAGESARVVREFMQRVHTARAAASVQ